MSKVLQEISLIQGLVVLSTGLTERFIHEDMFRQLPRMYGGREASTVSFARRVLNYGERPSEGAVGRFYLYVLQLTNLM